MIRSSFLALALFILSSSFSLGRNNSPTIDRIDPPHWWEGMTSDTLQLMVYGPSIANAPLSLEGALPVVEIVETVKPGSPDYLIAYLAIASEAQPHTFNLRFSLPDSRKSISKPYELRPRSMKGAAGFDASDVLYLIMPDRFAKGIAANDGHERDGLDFPSPDEPDNPNARHGGNIAGMIEHIPYIDSLGVTAIWVDPVLENDMPGGSCHRYATTDYYAINPRLGNNAEWIAFVDSCHHRGMKVMLDMIFNHCGSNHPWLHNLPSLRRP
ncbi:MAG: alpha-amylase family glycosyl hydrolase [Pseudoflavonifractor sp.]|nr:alpha-amylase family glycosyl hydrolase [Alloprevotella sp.]MCM1116872.1 alpha-amylase family glycosyl hydrolase [Pseudoflavonifractor sp.]